MSIVVRQCPFGFTQICLHFPGFTCKKRATRKEVKIAVTQGKKPLRQEDVDSELAVEAREI